MKILEKQKERRGLAQIKGESEGTKEKSRSKAMEMYLDFTMRGLGLF